MGVQEVTEKAVLDCPLVSGEVHVWTIRLDRMPAGARAFASTLSAEECARARRLKFPADRSRFVRSHTAARAILGAYLNVAPQDVAFEVDAAGKPRLDPRRHRATPHFSLSHSRDLAVLAVARCKVGVDVEHVRFRRDFDAVVHRYFSPEESSAYFALRSEARPRAFFAAWTLKEAYLKACGDGLSRRLDRFSVTVRLDEPARLLAAHDRPGDENRWRLLRLAPTDNYVGAVAAAASTVRLRERAWPGNLQ